jgi:hypothetical protein
MNAIAAHFLVEMDNNFGIGVRGKSMASVLELGTELREVVNFSVKNHPD